MIGRGAAAEAVALQFLQKKGLKLVAQNYRCRFGEIDLVMRDEATLVFTEVRLRASRDFGGAAASVTTQKQRKIILAAKHYLSELKQMPACRFDVALLDDINIDRVEWIKNAFSE